jgi:hypothetical protein
VAIIAPITDTLPVAIIAPITDTLPVTHPEIKSC